VAVALGSVVTARGTVSVTVTCGLGGSFQMGSSPGGFNVMLKPPLKIALIVVALNEVTVEDAIAVLMKVVVRAQYACGGFALTWTARFLTMPCSVSSMGRKSAGTLNVTGVVDGVPVKVVVNVDHVTT
jgi:hypothetical protein